MVGKRAKILTVQHVEDLLFLAHHTRHPIRNRVIVLLSLKAGLRAAEIANLTWAMVVDPTGDIATTLELQDRVAKKGGGRVIPIHPELREALMQLRADHSGTSGAVIQSERGGPMRPIAIVCWFARAYRAALDKRSSEADAQKIEIIALNAKIAALKMPPSRFSFATMLSTTLRSSISKLNSLG